MDLIPWDEDDKFGYYADYRAEYESMITEGFLERNTLELAINEARDWLKNPAAFHFYIMVFIAGRK